MCGEITEDSLVLLLLLLLSRFSRVSCLMKGTPLASRVQTTCHSHPELGWGHDDSHLALARDGVSREVTCSALKGETVPDSLPATPVVPREKTPTGAAARGNP